VVVRDLAVASGWNLKDSVVVLFQSKNVSGYYFVTSVEMSVKKRMLSEFSNSNRIFISPD